MNAMSHTCNDPLLRPVSDRENKEAGHLALCDQNVFDDQMAEIAALRSRQAAYLEGLPTTDRECIDSALRLLHEDAGEYPEGLEEALHLSAVLEAMIRHTQIADHGTYRDAALFIADRIQQGLQRTAKAIERIGDILGNPHRIERERIVCALRDI